MGEISYRRDPSLGQAELVSGSLEIHEICGDHETYIHGHVKDLVIPLGACNKKVERDMRAP